MYAIELFLDEDADAQVRRVWAALDEHGVTSLGSVPASDYHPHVTLSVFECGDPAAVLGALPEVAGLPLPLESLGFFPTAEAPVFLGVVPSARLLALHHAVHRAIAPIVDHIRPFYRPDALVPHCTLAVGVTDPARALEVAARLPLPIHAFASGARLVEVPGGRLIS